MTDGGGSPLVSVVVPTYYRNDRLVEAVESALGQSYQPVETIVVDDSGEGHARPAVAPFDDVRYVELGSNRGSNGARTAGARRARGEFVHFLDDDDVLYESKVEKQMAVMRDSPDLGVVYTGLDKTGQQSDLPDPGVRGDVLDDALAFELWPCMNTTMLIRAAVLEELLPLTDTAGAADLEMMIRLARRTRFEFVREPLAFKRIDMSSLGSSMTAVEGRKAIIERYVDLYATRPDRVRRRALANTYETEGALRLRTDGWSPRAVTAMLRHLYYEPDDRLKSVAKVVAACFGKPGWTALDRLGRPFRASRG